MTTGLDNVAFVVDENDKEEEKATADVVEILNEAGISFISGDLDLPHLSGPFLGLISRQTSVASGIPNVSIAVSRQNSVNPTQAPMTAESNICFSNDEKPTVVASSGDDLESPLATSSVGSIELIPISNTHESLSIGPVLRMPDPQGHVVEGEFPGSMVLTSNLRSDPERAAGAGQSRISTDPMSWLPAQQRFGRIVRRTYRPQRSREPELLSYKPFHATLHLP